MNQAGNEDFSPENLVRSLTEVFERIYLENPLVSIYLAGSYSFGNATPGSDIDILVFAKEEDLKKLQKVIQTQIRTDPRLPDKKVDCKLVSKKIIFSGTPGEYLFVFSAVEGGTLLFGEPISVKIRPDILCQVLGNIGEQLPQIEMEVQHHRNFSINSFLLFSITKSLHYLAKIIHSPDTAVSTPKEILGRNFFLLAHEYESLTEKGIQIGVSIALTKHGQRSGKFLRLTQAYPTILNYYQTTQSQFLEWFDKEI